MADVRLHEPSWERMTRAVEKIRDRVLRTARTLEAAGIPYAVVGGNAVADWVSRVDEAAVRNTRCWWAMPTLQGLHALAGSSQLRPLICTSATNSVESARRTLARIWRSSMILL